MAIKPKSRAHEERIKALEDRVATLGETLINLDSEFYCLKLELASERMLSKRPWYKRIFGL